MAGETAKAGHADDGAALAAGVAPVNKSTNSATAAEASGTRSSSRKRGPKSGSDTVAPAKRRKLRRRSGVALPARFSSLSDDVALLIFRHLGLARYTAAQVSRKWRELSKDSCFTIRAPSDRSLNDTIAAAAPGDTVVFPPGFYTEALLVEKPLRLVGEQLQNLAGQQRRSVVLQSRHQMVALCNARACFENMSFRTMATSNGRSIVGFGEECDYIRLENCELGGCNGMLLPLNKGPQTKLVLIQCYLHSSADQIPAVAIETGTAKVVGCTITGNSVGVDVMSGAHADVSNCDISFNHTALEFEGSGTVSHNTFWGNENVLGYNSHSASTFSVGQLDTDTVGALPAVVMAPSDSAAAAASASLGVAGGDVAGGRGRNESTGDAVVLQGNHVRAARWTGPKSDFEDEHRRKMKRLTRAVYGSHEPDYEDWEILGDTDLDTSEDGDDFSSGGDSAHSDGGSDSSSGGDSSSGWDTSDSDGSTSTDGSYTSSDAWEDHGAFAAFAMAADTSSDDDDYVPVEGDEPVPVPAE